MAWPLYLATDNGVQANTIADQSAAINSFLLSLPEGSTAVFPAVGAVNAQTRYYVNRAVEVPRTVRVMGLAWGIGAPIFTAMTNYGDAQIMRNWQYADFSTFTATNASPCVFTVSGGTFANGQQVLLAGGSLPTGFSANTAYYVVNLSGSTFQLATSAGGSGVNSTSTGSGTVQTFNAPDKTTWGNTGGLGSNFAHLENIAFDVNGNSSITALGLVHIAERSFIQNLTFNNSQGSTGSGNTAFTLFANSDAPGTISGRFVINSFTGYGLGWKNWVFADGTNGYTSSLAVANRINDIDITSFTSPANATTGGGNQLNGGTCCTDSTLFFRYIGRLHVVGHCETPPPNGTSDTAMIRTINCTDVLIENFYTLTGTNSYRPFLRATQDPNSTSTYPSVSGSQVGPCLQNITFSGGGGWAARTDASCVISSSGTSVTDAAIVAGDLYRPVYGPGIPSGAYVAAVGSGTFTLSATPLISATVSLVIGSNVIEDETATGGTAPGSGVIRHFQWNAALFSPHNIIDYCGTEITWTQFQSNASAVIRHARSACSSDPAINAMAPTGAIAESFPRALGLPASGTAILTSQTLTLTAVYMYPGDAVTNLTFWSGSTAANTPSNWWFAFFDPSRNQVAISADQTTGGWAANAKKTLAMGAAWTASLPGVHYAGILVNATTPPSIESVVQENTGSNNPVLNGTDSTHTGLTVPSGCPSTAAALTYVAGRPYVLVT